MTLVELTSKLEELWQVGCIRARGEHFDFGILDPFRYVEGQVWSS